MVSREGLLRSLTAFPVAFIVLFATGFLVLSWATLSDYGMAWDDVEFYLGDRNFAFYTTLDSANLDYDQRALSLYLEPGHPDFYESGWFQRRFPYHVWPLGATLSSATKHVLFTRLRLMDPIDAHHAAAVLCAAALLVLVYAFVYRAVGLWGAVAASVCLVSYPRFWAHLHYNVKDVAGCLFFSAVAITFWWALRRDSWRLVVTTAVLWGLGLASKGNALFLPFICGPFLLHDLWRRKGEGRRLPGSRLVASLLAVPIIAVAVMLASWPWLLVNWPEHLQAHLRWVAERGMQGPDHWQLMPTIKAVTTMPLPVMVLAAIGLAVMLKRLVARPRAASFELLVSLWLVVPVLRVSIPGAFDYDGIRHWLEFVPAVAVVVGIGVEALLGRIRAALSLGAPGRERLVVRVALGAAILLWFAPVIVWDVRNHPHEYVFFNSLVGGLRGAQARGIPEATDYWCLSYREGIEWLNHHAPPGAEVVVSVGQHTVRTVQKIWLRKDIAVIRLPEFGYDQKYFEALIQAIRDRPQDVFLMTVTREERYGALARFVDANQVPEYQILVDGAPILKLFRIDKAGLPNVTEVQR